jgi:hypothetical protein
MPFSVNDIDDFHKFSPVFRPDFAPIQDIQFPIVLQCRSARMRNEPKRAPLAEQSAQPEDTTEPMAHRRTTVTVERETVTFIIRRENPASPEIRNEPNDTE